VPDVAPEKFLQNRSVVVTGGGLPGRRSSELFISAISRVKTQSDGPVSAQLTKGPLRAKAVVTDGAADWSNRLKPTIRPELETWPFFTHIDIGNYPWADYLW
jgi:hypothetical protein